MFSHDFTSNLFYWLIASVEIFLFSEVEKASNEVYQPLEAFMPETS